MVSQKYSWNNLMAMIIIFLIIFSLWSFWMTNQSIEATSKSISATVSLCYEKDKPSLDFISPAFGDILFGNTSIKTECKLGPEHVANVSFSLLNDSYSYNMGFVDTDKLGFFIKTINTTNFPDGNCNYRVYASVRYNNTCTLDGTAISDYFTINNRDEPPIWNNFKNSKTTNFSLFSSWINLSNVNISDDKYGMINFPFNTNFDSANLDDFIRFSKGNIFISRNLKCIKQDILTKNASIYFYNLSYLNPGVYRDGRKSSLVTVKSYINHTLFFRILAIGNFTAYEKGALGLKIFDDTDGIRSYHVKQDINFYANLTGSTTHKEYYSPNITCAISFPHFNDTNILLKYNHTLQLYQYKRQFLEPGEFDWLVYCNATSIDLGEANAQNKFRIVNRDPVLTSELPNETWPKNSVLTGRDLEDYFFDIDNDTLTYNFSPIDNIHVYINSSTHVYTAIPESNWYGNRTIVFSAHDPWGGSASSNEVYFYIKDVTPPPPQGSSSRSQKPNFCEADWQCSEWSKCYPNGIKTRECVDKNYCNSTYSAPSTVVNCTYRPTCSDHIKNQNETGVDCGGPCDLCPTCNDGIKNQGEKGIDCGGPCDPCPTCNDGIWNENESGIDCGGPCMACPTCFDGLKNGNEEGQDCGGNCKPCEKVVEIEKPAMSNAFWSIFLISLLTATSIALVLKNKIFELFEKIKALFKRMFSKINENDEIFFRFLEDAITVQSKIEELKISKDSEELKDVIENFFTYTFGYFNIEVIKKEIPFSIYNGSVKELMNEILDKNGNTNFDEVLQIFSNLVSETFINKTELIGESYETTFNKCVGEVTKSKEFKSLKKLVYDVYLKLPIETKGKVYKSLKEIDALSEKMKTNKGMLLGVLLGLMLIFSIFFTFNNSVLTGFSVKDNETSIVLQLPETIQIPVGETFHYDLRIFGGKPPYNYYVSSNLIQITNGTIDIMPFYETGKYQFEIKILDDYGNSGIAWLNLDVVK